MLTVCERFLISDQPTPATSIGSNHALPRLDSGALDRGIRLPPSVQKDLEGVLIHCFRGDEVRRSADTWLTQWKRPIRDAISAVSATTKAETLNVLGSVSEQPDGENIAGRKAAMCRSFGRLLLVVIVSLLTTAMANADEKSRQPSGPIFDITHFDVIPLNQGGVDFQQVAYPALFKYRDATKSDKGSESFRIVNWLEAPNHSHIIDVWRTLLRTSRCTWLSLTASIFVLPYRSNPLRLRQVSIAASEAQSTIASTG